MKFAHVRYDSKDRVVVRFDDAHLVSLETLLASTGSEYVGAMYQDMYGVIREGQMVLEEIDTALENFMLGTLVNPVVIEQKEMGRWRLS